MNIVITLNNDTVGVNVARRLMGVFEFMPDTASGWELLTSIAIGDTTAKVVVTSSMVDELPPEVTANLEAAYHPDAVIMVAFHHGPERQTLILRGSGEAPDVSHADPSLMQYLAKTLQRVCETYGLACCFEATHGYKAAVTVPFCVLELGGCEEDWSAPNLGEAMAEVINALSIYHCDPGPIGTAIAFGRSHCSSEVLRRCTTYGISHYFSERTVMTMTDSDIVNLLAKCGCPSYILLQKRIASSVESVVQRAADSCGVEVVRFK